MILRNSNIHPNLREGGEPNRENAFIHMMNIYFSILKIFKIKN